MQSTLTKPKLWKEITLVVTLKIIVIMAIWYFWFSDPVEKHLTTEKVAQQMVGAVDKSNKRENYGNFK